MSAERGPAQGPREPFGDRAASFEGGPAGLDRDPLGLCRIGVQRRAPDAAASQEAGRPGAAGKSYLLDERVGVSAGPEEGPGRVPAGSTERVAGIDGDRLGGRLEVQHGKRQLEQIGAQRLESLHGTDHELRIRAAVGCLGLTGPAVGDRFDDEWQAVLVDRQRPSS